MPPDLLLHAAQRLLEMGLSVIPVGDDKKPTIKWEAFQQARPSIDNLTVWFRYGSPKGVGVVTGKISNLVVVDTDNEAAEAWAQKHLPPTPMMCRTAKGFHRYYRHPGGEVRNGVRVDTADGPLAIDIRGDGGYVVGPGSTHPSGIIYSAPNPWPKSLDEVPRYSPAWFQSAPKPAVPSPPSAGAFPEGQRNSSLTRLAGSMRRRGASHDATLAALRAENAAKCVPPLEDSEVVEIAESMQRYTPDEAAVPSVIRLVSERELLTRPEPTALVEGRIFENTLITLYGPPGAGKTFVALDIAYSLATGLDWLGAPVCAPGSVVYVAAEGVGGLNKRVRAWRDHRRHVDEADVLIGESAINLMELGDTQRLIDAIGEKRPQLVVFDTLARCLIGGDENAAKDMGTAVRHCDLLRSQLGAAVLLVHHSQKSGPVERGSSALRGACDTMLQLESTNDLLTLSCDKQKDALPFSPLSLAVRPIASVNSCVIQLANPHAIAPQLTQSEQKALAALRQQFGAEGARSVQWQQASVLPERTFNRAKTRLQDLGYVHKAGNIFAITGKDASGGY